MIDNGNTEISNILARLNIVLWIFQSTLIILVTGQ